MPNYFSNQSVVSGMPYLDDVVYIALLFVKVVRKITK